MRTAPHKSVPPKKGSIEIKETVERSKKVDKGRNRSKKVEKRSVKKGRDLLLHQDAFLRCF